MSGRALFDDPGLFWVPEQYKREKVEKTAKAPRILPGIPETGWVPRAVFPDLSTARAISIDTETYDPDLRTKGPGARRDGHIVGVSVAADDFCAYYPLRHTIGENLDPAPVFAWLRDQLGRKKQPKIGANLLYDLEYLEAEGVHVEGPFYDIQFADPLIYEYEASYSLEAIAERRLGLHKETSLLYQWCADAYGGKPDGLQRENIWRAPVSLVGPYAEADARLPLQIIRKQWPLLRSMQQLDIFELESRLIPLLLHMRQQGVRISEARCDKVDRILCKKIEQLQKQIGLNVYAAAELAAMCEQEGIEYLRTEAGNPSFTKGWLKEQTHPKLRNVNELRTLYKMRDTFVRGALLGMQIYSRIHAQFNPLRSDEYGTVSGRFSSSNPNLQQIPARDKVWGPILRSCFIPDDDLAWFKLDLSQIEFRLGVHYGVGEGIEEVREAYRADPKTSFYKLAASMTGLPYGEAKSLSLGTLYGMGEDKFGRMIGKSKDETHAIFTQYNAKLPFMRATYDHVGEQCRQRGEMSESGDGWVRTIGGRLCHLQHGYEHKALNRQLQGSCADWMKRSMLLAWEAGIFDVLRIYLTVHDELDSGVPRSRAGAQAARELHDIFVNCYPLTIPVLASASLGRSWGKLSDAAPEEFERLLLSRAPTIALAA